MTNGLMMASQLTVTSILRHAQKFHPHAEIVSRLASNEIHRYTYADFGRRVHQLANALVDMGVRPGDRVATLAWNGYRHMEIYYAVSCLGAICHTINPRLFQEQLSYIANHAEDTHLFFDLHFAKLVEGLAGDLKTVRGYVALCEADELPDVELPNLTAYETLIADKSDRFDWPELDEWTASALCYTSGTTGNPKGVLYNHRSTVIHALSVSGGDWLAIRARDAILPVVPMFHANAWGIPYAGLMNGAKLVLPGHAMDGRSLAELVIGEGVTLMAGVPTVWLELLRHLRETGQRLDRVERMMVGGSAAPYAMIKAFEEDHDVRVVHGWGMTELSPVGTLGALKGNEVTLPAEERYKIQSLQGRPLYGVELRIVDAEGKALPHDGVSSGILQVRGPWVASGYYKGDAPEQFTEDGWFSTGDLAALDEEGHLRITDRTKDVIKSGGEWISSIDIENVAVGHPKVAEVACIAVPHSKWGERPMICVVPQDGEEVDPAEVLAMYDGKVAKWWIPDHVEVVESLPHTATGKLSKLTLRERFADFRLPTDQ
ncbi:long-chain-fatty-acid--CoA ligase [uncultured Roseibium sp.]|uniref:long-chain-fatty-acid--CoA ligase n=1 Tax=uncultured Roseibium sp. TaxID=1936171 RepID=UPI003216ACB4